MSKSFVITGAGSGIGAATGRTLRERGHRVIGVDLRGAEVTADLATAEGRAAMAADVARAAPDGIDGFLAGAGVSPDQGDAEAILRINYFGAIATAEGLRPLLARSAAPRAVMVASTSILMAPDEAWADRLLLGDEATALAERRDDPSVAYMSGKLAVARWTRRAAVSAEWAGAGIALNCVSPGVFDTPMNTKILASAEGMAMLAQAQPNALGRVGQPEEIARAIAFLLDDCPAYLLGQVLYVDGGTDAILRPRAC